MNQYALVPIDRASALRFENSIATPDTWKVEKDGVLYGGFEKEVFSIFEVAMINLNAGLLFTTPEAVSLWLSA